jgi:Rrf2 family protein
MNNNTILRISEAASIAMHTMFLLAQNKQQSLSTKDIAGCLGVSDNHLAKVLQRLTKAGLVISIRGPKGGFKVNQEKESITLLEIYEAIDGPLQSSNCLLSKQVCHGNCLLGELISTINNNVSEYFKKTNIYDFVNT